MANQMNHNQQDKQNRSQAPGQQSGQQANRNQSAETDRSSDRSERQAGSVKDATQPSRRSEESDIDEEEGRRPNQSKDSRNNVTNPGAV